MSDLRSMLGRQWLASQEDSITSPDCNKVPAISAGKCQRCGSLVTGLLPDGKRYCRVCLGIGRIVEGDYLIRLEESESFPTVTGGLVWKGQLTPEQEIISRQLIANFASGQDTLVHAVTGAGKTAMIYQVIANCLAAGKRACIATPRIDVVNELFGSFKTAFAGIKLGKYHGHDFHEPERDQLTICTTHQLLKFYHAFDLLIIDEVDSFPYVNSPELHFGARNAVKKQGVRFYLTATPPADLLQEVKTGKVQRLMLKRRFHGHALPIPKEKLFLKPFLVKDKINRGLLKEIVKVVKAGHPLLLFVSKIKQIPLYLAALAKEPSLAKIKLAGVHAADAARLDKVEAFRNGEIDLLVTTTILERGVTFAHVWVIIVSADDAIYSTASLVQIAGRVGRAEADPDGLIMYCYNRYTKEIRESISQIKEMNR